MQGARRKLNRLWPLLAIAAWTVMVFGVTVMHALADESAGSLNTGIENLSATYTGVVEGHASWTIQSGEITGSVKGTAGSGCSSATHHETTLTLKNTSSSTATLKFKYKINNENYLETCTVNGETATTSDKTFEKNLAGGESIQITIKSKSTDQEGKITISNISLEEVIATATTTFSSSDYGTYTVDGVAITGSTVYSDRLSTSQYALKITSVSPGYRFVGWKDITHEKYLGSAESQNLGIVEDCTIQPIFAKSDCAMYSVGTANYSFLDEAITAATAGSNKKIIVIADGTVYGSSGQTTFTIPSGVTLLVPFDDAATVYKATPGNTGNSYTKPTAFRTLTLESDYVLKVNGILCISAKLSAKGNAAEGGGATSGPYGRLDTKEGSSIILQSGSALYAWGYLSGAGRVTAESGSNVYEGMQIRDFRGGSALTGGWGTSMNKTGAQDKVFPLSQYFVQNIEASITFEYGSKETLQTFLYAAYSANGAAVDFLSSTNAMFNLKNGCIVTKQYTYSKTNPRLTFTISGDAELSALSLGLGGYKVDSSSFDLALNSGITINIVSGNISISQDLALLPGVEIIIGKDAIVTVEDGKYFIAYDLDEWKKEYIHSDNYNASYSTSGAPNSTRTGFGDAKVDVNGQLILDGYIYTTNSGANITSSEGSGIIKFNNGAGAKTKTYQGTQSNTTMTFVEIPVTSAKLLNGDGSYTATAGAAAGTTYYYCATHDKWETERHDSASYNVTISWPELEFTYTRSTSTTYTWDGEGKKYKSETTNSGSWTDNSKDIKVLNTSSAGDVNAQFNFTAQAGLQWTAGPSMAFTCGETAVTDPITVPVTTNDEGTTVTATLSGTPAAGFTEGQIGTITVTITAAQGG